MLYLSLACIALVLYWATTRNHRYWADRGVPGPTPWPLFGTHFSQFFVPMQELETQRFEKFGKIYGVYDGTTPGLIVGDPELIKPIMCGTTALNVFTNRRAVKTTHPVMSKFLSSLEGRPWRRVRSLTTKAFAVPQLKSMIPTMQHAAELMLAHLNAATSNASMSGPVNIDLKRLFGTYTMDVIALSAFATTPDIEFIQQASALFTFPFWRKFLDYVAPMWVLDSFGFTVLPKEPMAFFRQISADAINTREQERHTGMQPARPRQGKDFLDLLMDVWDDMESGTNHKLTKEEILAQCVLFFSVGYETSSQLLMYCSYCLALNPDCQQRLYDELSTCIGTLPETEHADCIVKSPYLKAVIDETLRLYNPVLRMERRASEDFELGTTGIIVRKGMLVGIPVWALHHSCEHFPDPERFMPNRFLPENKHHMQDSTYLPFGQGPRNCIGKQFSLMESKLALAEIILKYQLTPTASTTAPLQFVPTGRPLLGPREVCIGFQKRNLY